MGQVNRIGAAGFYDFESIPSAAGFYSFTGDEEDVLELLQKKTPTIKLWIADTFKDEIIPIHALFKDGNGVAQWSTVYPVLKIYDALDGTLKLSVNMLKVVHTGGLYVYQVRMAIPYIEGRLYLAVVTGTISGFVITEVATFRYEDKIKLNYIYQKEVARA
jgi:hypothetical protein